MVYKKVLRFYFSADGLNSAIDNLMCGIACSSGGVLSCERYAQRLINICEDKKELSLFWWEIQGVISLLTVRDIAALKNYASLRSGTRRLPEGEQKELHRAVIKFSRRAAKKLNGCKIGYAVLKRYYSLVPSEPD